jgi:hypothetical protein
MDLHEIHPPPTVKDENVVEETSVPWGFVSDLAAVTLGLAQPTILHKLFLTGFTFVPLLFYRFG